MKYSHPQRKTDKNLPEVRVLLVGFGFMGKMHAAVYHQLAGVTLAGIVDPQVDAAQAHLKSMRISCPVFSRLSEAEGILMDAVDICLPTDLHPTAVAWAARFRKPIFCEKPIALDFRAARAMLRQVERAKVFFQVGHCIRFWPEYQALESFVRSKRGGKLLSLSLQRRAARPQYSHQDWLNGGGRSGGAALDLHIHDTDFVHHLLGRPHAVHSLGTQDRSGWSHIFTHYEYPTVRVTAEGGWNYPPKWGFQMAFQAVFEKATMEYDSNSKPTLSVVLGSGKRKPWPFQAPNTGKARGAGGNLSSLGGYTNELMAFLQCLRSRRKPQIATGEQAADSLRTVLAEIASARTGKVVRLKSGGTR